MASPDPNIRAHQEWIGFAQPHGLVVSAPALVQADAILNRHDRDGQRLLRKSIQWRALPDGAEPVPFLPDFRAFAEQVLGWNFSPKGYAGTAQRPVPDELQVEFPEYGVTLCPDLAVQEFDPKEGALPWQLLVQVLDTDADFDRPVVGNGQLEATAHGAMERLLRHTGVGAGLLFNGTALRLVSAPRGESSGWVDFRVADMEQTGGRPLAAAMRLLLGQDRLLAGRRERRLAALLEQSRKFQNQVSERLAKQVLHALYELLRGLQAAHNDSEESTLLREPLGEHPDQIYHGLLTVILRLVFLLYAEERDMLPDDPIFRQFYSLAALHARLRADAAQFPDTMDQRYGAWAQLLVLFRMFHDGAQTGSLHLPPRHGVLFDPDRFRFLEGRSGGGTRQIDERIDSPRVSDGAIYRALDKLLVLNGERISYRTLDVEQIGSVYETMMGFRLETAAGRSAAIRAQQRHGAPATVNLEALLAEPAGSRAKWLQERTDRKLSDAQRKTVAAATTLEELHAALLPVIETAATPDLVPAGAMVLQPSAERRRSGSHYTPRELTEPIVRTALEPLLTHLRTDRHPPLPEEILELKVCDPAMGSGAFLVEACRQLGDALVESWHAHGITPRVPADEDEVIFARRLVAQRCLYGVDRNPMAVDLAKVSLWLVTLAKEHPLTFIDHALRHGDSLVGLSRRQLQAFHWDFEQPLLGHFEVRGAVDAVTDLRRRIQEADDSVPDWRLRHWWQDAQAAVDEARLSGDLVTAAFFKGSKRKEREARRNEYANAVVSGHLTRYRNALAEWRQAALPLAPFHWQIEFPEVFDRRAPGFDAVVGNPPFAGHATVVAANIRGYTEWLRLAHSESAGKCDVVAHFFRRAFHLVRRGGAIGLIATNTIAQGDTRASGLRWICQHGGDIYAVRRRAKWPGVAAVVVSVLHLMKGAAPLPRQMDGHPVDMITAFLFHRGGHDDPARLMTNSGKSFQGSIVLGMGFTFDDSDRNGVATPLTEMHRLMASNPANREVIFPYIGGEEVNTGPTQSHHRYIIRFGERSEEECRQRWPELLAIVEERVKPARVESSNSR